MVWGRAFSTSGADPRLNAEECLLGGIRRWWGRCAGWEMMPLSFFSKSLSSSHLKKGGLDYVGHTSHTPGANCFKSHWLICGCVIMI